MSKFITLVIGTLALALSQHAVLAADISPAEQIAQTIELPAHVPHMDFAAASEFIGVYELSNGEALKIGKRGLSLYASLDSSDVRHRVVATGKNTFVSVDKQLKIHLEFDKYGDVSGEVYIAQGINQLPVMASVR